MVYKPQRNFKPLPPEYVEAHKQAMRYLASQGLSAEEIREARWGMVDEADKVISIPTSVIHIKYNRDTGFIFKEITDGKTIKIPIKDTGLEWFFLKSRIMCPWMFTRVIPKTWRKEGSKECLYSLSEIEEILADLCSTPISDSVLTNLLEFDTIEVSKLNFTKLKTERATEEIVEAEVLMRK